MAEASGFRSGVIGLAKLFNNAIDYFEYIHIGKNFGGDFKTYLLKLDNAMSRLSRWGEAIGLSGYLTDTSALPSWIKPEEKEITEKILGHIINLFEHAIKEAAKFKNGKNKKDPSLNKYNNEKDLDGLLKTFH